MHGCPVFLARGMLQPSGIDVSFSLVRRPCRSPPIGPLVFAEVSAVCIGEELAVHLVCRSKWRPGAMSACKAPHSNF